MASISNIRLSGVNIAGKQSVDQFGFADLSLLTASYLSGKLPLEFDLNVEALNPNNGGATLSAFDWILILDDQEVTRGTNEQQITIPGKNGTAMFPIHLQVDLLNTFSQASRESLLNLALNIADAGGKPSEISLKIKPTVYVNETIPLEYPGYITLGTEFGQ